jgi:uncharacterized membrane protein YozB (DUF420 family)
LSTTDLPAVNASLNALSAMLLTAGYGCIRAGKKDAHRACMIAAFSVSTVFLVCYVIYHLQVGSVKFTGQGWIRPVYFFVLITHILLAACTLPLAVVTLFRGLAGRFPQHRAIARWALPVWWYVSVTGVVVYWMLYHLYRS